MPISRITFVRSTILFVILGFVALLIIVGATFWLVELAQNYSDSVNYARQQRGAIIDLRGEVQDAETGQRGYLLTSNQDYLAPYLSASAKFPGQLNRVRSLLAADPDTKGDVDRLASVLTDKMAELDRTIELDRAGKHDEAIAIVKTNLGRNLMDEARGIFTRLIDVAEARVTDTLERQKLNISHLRTIALVSGLAIMAIAGGSIWMIFRYTKQLIEAETEVTTLNASLESRVRERTAELARANEEVQRFAYIVTHDLRAPLVNVMGFTSELETGLAAFQGCLARPDSAEALAAARIAATEDMPEAIGFIRSSTTKMDGLINAILKLSREGRRTLRPERIDLGALLRTAVANVQHQVTEVGGEVTIQASVPAILSDRMALEQVFGNLLDNAIKYKSPDRSLAVRIRARQERGRRVFVDVEDNGRGIAEVDHERVFDLFRRSGAQDQRGEGIGLAHVRVIVRNLGGEITVKSKLGQGTTFTVNLPTELNNLVGAV